ncbi:MAG: epoxyqueuosine reductase [Solirubrobacterales bacterium]
MLFDLISELNTRGADFFRVVDVSMLPKEENQGYGIALLIGSALSPNYILRGVKEKKLDKSEFRAKECLTDKLAELAEEYIVSKGYKAFAQSERNLSKNGYYDDITKTTSLPHKKIAMMAGLGWIGKSNLLVTRKYGSAICMSSVLTNIPVSAENKGLIMPECGECTICQDNCPSGAIKGTIWEIGMDRSLIVDVNKCSTCLKCLIKCPYTLKYMKKIYDMD